MGVIVSSRFAIATLIHTIFLLPDYFQDSYLHVSKDIVFCPNDAEFCHPNNHVCVNTLTAILWRWLPRSISRELYDITGRWVLLTNLHKEPATRGVIHSSILREPINHVCTCTPHNRWNVECCGLKWHLRQLTFLKLGEAYRVDLFLMLWCIWCFQSYLGQEVSHLLRCPHFRVSFHNLCERNPMQYQKRKPSHRLTHQ